MTTNTPAQRPDQCAATTTPQSDVIREAWDIFRASYGELIKQFGTEASQQFDHPLMIRADHADIVMATQPAPSLASVALKLRRLFMQQVQEPWAERLAMGEDTPETRNALHFGDMWEQALWLAIEDVEHLAGREG